MRLERVAKKVVAHFKQQGFPLSLVIDVHDPREWNFNWAEHLDACYNPGFDHLNASDEELKEAFISALNLEEIKQTGITKKWIDLKGQKFVLTGCQMHAPHTSCHVNNMGRCLDNPFDKLQQTIDSKNKKHKTYLGNCDVCDLLVVVDSVFVNFESVQKHKFNSVFRNVYLLDLSFGCKVTKLNI